MMKDFKTGLRLIRYSYGIKTAILCTIIFLLSGITMQFSNTMSFMGAFFLLIIAMWPTQMLYTLSMSSLVQTSKKKKALRTTIPTLINFAGIIFIYLIVLVVKVVQVKWNPELTSSVTMEMMMLGISMGLVMFYTALAYKYFIISTIFFVIVYIASYSSYAVVSGVKTRWIMAITGKVSIYTAGLIGILFLLFGALIEYGISRLVYKAPMSKMAQMASLRKQL